MSNKKETKKREKFGTIAQMGKIWPKEIMSMWDYPASVGKAKEKAILSYSA